MDGWADGWMDGWADGWMDGWMYGSEAQMDNCRRDYNELADGFSGCCCGEVKEG